jgi:hypothetical protein
VIVWKAISVKTNKILTTTMGAAVDLESEGLRRLIVNGCYWAVGLENKIPAKANVTTSAGSRRTGSDSASSFAA